MGLVTFTEGSVRRQLDDQAEAFIFPVLDNAYVDIEDVRPSAYRDQSRWAILIEVLGVWKSRGSTNGSTRTWLTTSALRRRRPSASWPACW